MALRAIVEQQFNSIMKNSHELSFRESVDRMFDRATATMDLPPGLADQIRCCNSVYQVQFGVKLDDRYEVFTGWRAVHSEHILPVKGGIRYAVCAAAKGGLIIFLRHRPKVVAADRRLVTLRRVDDARSSSVRRALTRFFEATSPCTEPVAEV